MGKLIIDGNSVFEIDEECVKKRKNVPKSCDVEKYMTKSGEHAGLMSKESDKR